MCVPPSADGPGNDAFASAQLIHPFFWQKWSRYSFHLLQLVLLVVLRLLTHPLAITPWSQWVDCPWSPSARFTKQWSPTVVTARPKFTGFSAWKTPSFKCLLRKKLGKLLPGCCGLCFPKKSPGVQLVDQFGFPYPHLNMAPASALPVFRVGQRGPLCVESERIGGA